MRKHVASISIAALAMTAIAAPAVAAGSNEAEGASAYQVAATVTPDATTVEPTAIPGVVALATVSARLFTAARAPQQVSQVLRAAGFLSGIFGAVPSLSEGSGAASIDVIFDH